VIPARAERVVPARSGICETQRSAVAQGRKTETALVKSKIHLLRSISFSRKVQRCDNHEFVLSIDSRQVKESRFDVTVTFRRQSEEAVFFIGRATESSRSW